MALSTGGSAASRGTSLGAEVRQAPPVMDDYRGVVYNALVAQGPIERRRRARTQPGLDRGRRVDGRVLAPRNLEFPEADRGLREERGEHGVERLVALREPHDREDLAQAF